MREIKFRAWDSILKTMVEPSVYAVVIGTGKVFFDNDGDLLDHTDKLTLMQYTGLKDKNGVEIYEGDVMSQTFDKRPTSIIVFETFGGWKFEWIDKVFKRVRQSKREPIFHNISLFEVIGNIYENPDFLKENKTQNH